MQANLQANLNDYKTIVDIFKGYLDTALTANIWVYAITGAIVTNYLNNRKEIPKIIYSLFLPLFLTIALSYISLKGIWQASELNKKVFEVTRILEIQGAPPIEILISFLWATFFLSGAVSLLIIVFLLIAFWRWVKRPKIEKAEGVQLNLYF